MALFRTIPSQPMRSLEEVAVHVDIVVNNHNYGVYVRAAIDSALAQTHPHVRVIVVDDGSTDDSRKILRAYEDRVDLVLQENGGQASALNSGFSRCTGDVVIFLDADDELAPDVGESVADIFAARPATVKVQYRMEVIDEAGRRTGIYKPSPHLPLPRGDVSRAELMFPFDLVWLATSGNAFSTNALRRLLPLPENEFRDCPDWFLVHLAPLLGSVESLDRVGAYYRVHGRNSYEPQSTSVDLDHIRQTIVYAHATQHALTQLAEELGLVIPHRGPLSVSDCANRLISLKLAPQLHPIAGDAVRQLALDGCRAALRRFDIRWPLKVAVACWFAAVAAAPVSSVRTLAEIFLFPERRERLNPALRLFNRRRTSRAV